jgi:hypothetical protein
MAVYSFCAFAVFIDICKFIKFIRFVFAPEDESLHEYYIEFSQEQIQDFKSVGFFANSVQLSSDEYLIIEEENRVYFSDRTVGKYMLDKYVTKTNNL